MGSFPLDSAAAVFSAVGQSVGDLVRQIPDGETGPRKHWIVFQRDRIMQLDTLEQAGSWKVGNELVYPLLVPREGLRPEQIQFGALGYAECARRSYADFVRLKAEGALRDGVKMQVSLPTPLAVVFCFFAPEVRKQIWPVYERAMAGEVARLCEIIPPEELAIQWDVAAEIVGVLENPQNASAWSLEELCAGIARAVSFSPQAVDTGIHLCYGDVDGRHVIEPNDMGLMVRMANAVRSMCSRSLEWIHMPVPINRDDDAYFAPLEYLQADAVTRLYLGLVHVSDGIAGAQRRLGAARRFVRNFGIATECGLGRRSPRDLSELLKLHRSIAELP